METKGSPPAGGETNNQPHQFLNQKINQFLISYFNYFIFVLAAVILAAGLLIFAYPKYRQIYQNNEAIKNNSQTGYEAKVKYLAEILDLKKSYQLISEDEKKKIANMASAENDNGRLITEIEAIIIRNGAILDSIKIEANKLDAQDNSAPAAGENQAPPGINTAKIEINLSSVSYPVLKNILKSFENSLKLFDITKVTFDSQKNGAKLMINSYYSSEVNSLKKLSGFDLTIFSSDKFKKLEAYKLTVEERPATGKRDPFQKN